MSARHGETVLIAFVICVVAACGSKERALPYCDGNVLHREAYGPPYGYGTEREEELHCARCMEVHGNGDWAECVVEPLVPCNDSHCSFDGSLQIDCGATGYATAVSHCDPGTVCYRGEGCMECGAPTYVDDGACSGTCGGCSSFSGCPRCEPSWGRCDDEDGVGTCTCIPACAGRTCGPDGCGDSCGKCGQGTVCMAGQCTGLDVQSYVATRIQSIQASNRLALIKDDPCWIDADGDGTLDVEAAAWAEGFDNYFDGTYHEWFEEPAVVDNFDAGNTDRLLLLPHGATSPFDAVYAWGRPSPQGNGVEIVQTLAYERPVPPVILSSSMQDEGVLQTGRADIYLFDVSLMEEGTSWSSTNAYYLQRTYVPIRDAAFQGTVSLESGSPVLIDGTLKGTLRRSDLEHAVWLAQAHCAMSGHGSGTCQSLDEKLSGDLQVFFWWQNVPEMVDAETAPFCAHVTGTQVSVTAIAPR